MRVRESGVKPGAAQFFECVLFDVQYVATPYRPASQHPPLSEGHYDVNRGVEEAMEGMEENRAE